MSSLNLKIDVTKILKEHLFEGKNGAKYLDITLWENRDGVDAYGNTHMAVQSIPKALRDTGVKGPILGNAKPFGDSAPPQQRPSGQRSQGQQRPQQSTQSKQSSDWDDDGDSIPF